MTSSHALARDSPTSDGWIVTAGGFPGSVGDVIMSGMRREGWLAVGLAAPCAIVLATAVAADAFAGSPPSSLPVNQVGPTYGSVADADGPEHELDLIFVLGVNGHDGYVRKSDLGGPTPRSPEEAIAMQESGEGRRGRDIPVYDQSGENVIDTFHIAGSAETSTN